MMSIITHNEMNIEQVARVCYKIMMSARLFFSLVFSFGAI